MVFEPNDDHLIGAALVGLGPSSAPSGARALTRQTPEEAFFVKCDLRTMTQDDIYNGRLICEIGIAPVKPAEFVIFRIQQKTLER